MFFFLYNGGDSFSLMFKLYGNMNLLEVNAWLWRKLESYSNLANLDYICEQFGDTIWFFHKDFSTDFVKISSTKSTTQSHQCKR
jgi:hypothetical protein